MKHQITQVTHLPYSPDLVPCNFWLSLWKGRYFRPLMRFRKIRMGQLMAIGRTVWGPKVPTLKGTEASLFYVQCFLYLISSSINASIFHSICLDTLWTNIYMKLITLQGRLRWARGSSVLFSYAWNKTETKGIELRALLNVFYLSPLPRFPCATSFVWNSPFLIIWFHSILTGGLSAFSLALFQSVLQSELWNSQIPSLHASAWNTFRLCPSGKCPQTWRAV